MKIFIFIYLLIISILSMYCGQNIYNSNLEKNITFDIYNYTENNFIWNYTLEKKQIDNIETNNTYNRFINIIDKGIDFMGYSLFEMSKFFIELGFKHPEYNFKYIMNIIKYLLYAVIIFYVFLFIMYLFFYK